MGLMLTVLCLKAGTRYSPQYVAALHRAVSRFINVPHRFVCMTDDPRGLICETMPIPLNLPGWWGKIAAFAPIWDDRVIVPSRMIT
jgi:hypothetical protein